MAEGETRYAARRAGGGAAASPFVASVLALASTLGCGTSPAGLADSDGDGFARGEDCADGDPNRFPGAVEVCNGFDDDCDGVVDEGFPDLDGDGRLDCWGDEQCTPAVDRVFEVARTCPAPLEDPWDVVVTWQLDADDFLDDGGGVAPRFVVVAHLDDDDGDGVVGSPGDDVEVVGFGASYDHVLADSEGRWGAVGGLVVVDGPTGTIERSLDLRWFMPPTDMGAPAVADVDADGAPEIVGVELDGLLRGDEAPPALRVVAITPTGEVDWRSARFCEDCFTRSIEPFNGRVLWRYRYAAFHEYVSPTVTDLEGDGAPEVLFDRLVLDGRTGRIEHTLPARPRGPVLPVDVDGDGVSELVANGDVWGLDGVVRWSRTARLAAIDDAAASLDVDADGTPELAFVTHVPAAPVAEVRGLDGGMFLDVPIYTDVSDTWLILRGGGALTVDPDGSGRRELWVPVLGGPRGSASSDDGPDASYLLRIGDGARTLLPIASREDALLAASHWGGQVAFDLDGDMSPEVFFSTPGVTGLVSRGERVWSRRFPDPPGRGTLEGGTVAGGLAIADVDADGSADLVSATAGGSLVVRSHRDGGWMASGRTWPQAPFRAGAVAEDGTVRPAAEPAAVGMTQARPVTEPLADLEVAIVGRCLASCAGELALLVQVGNRGVRPLAEGAARVELVAADGTVLANADVPALASAEVSPAIALGIDDTARLGAPRATVRVVPPSDVPQCDPSDDVVVWDFADACPPLG